MATSAFAVTLADQFSSIAVFGDSLSDTGNLFATTELPPAPYFDGRLSNGPVWSEAIEAEIGGSLGGVGPLGVPTNNFAFGGARADFDFNSSGPVPSVLAQVGVFAAGGNSFDPDTLATVWAGANDIFQDLEDGNGTAVGTETAMDVAVIVSSLISLEAKNLLVFNLPDFGVIPRFATDPLIDDASDAIAAYNATLAASLQTLDDLNEDVTIFTVDIFALFNDVVADPAAFGFANVEDECIFTLACVLGDQATQDTFLFWDDVHPTTAGHAFVEAAARAALTPAVVPLPAGAPLYILAMLGLAIIRQRRT